jgi:oligosaccharide repeat unit polymerase
VLGSFLIWKANRDIFSPNFLILIVWIFNFTGGIIISLTEAHYFTVFLISLGVFSFGLGSYFCTAIMRFKPIKELENYRKKPITFMFSKSINFAVLLISFFLTLILAILYFHYAGIPLFSKDVSTIRINTAAGKGLFIRAIDTFLPVLMLLSFMGMKGYKSKGLKLLFCIITVTNIIAAIFIGTRGQVIMYVLLFILLYSLTISRIRISKLVFLVIFFLIFALFLQMRYADWRSSSIWVHLRILFSRFTVSQVLGLDFIVYYLVPQSGFSLGEVLLNDFKGFLYTLRVVNTYTPPFWVILFELMYGKNPRGSFIMTTTPVGDLYLDFGMVGVVLGMFMLGNLSQMLYIYTLRSRKDWLLSTGLIYLQFSIIMVNVLGGFFTVISAYVLSLIMFLSLILFLAMLFLLLRHILRKKEAFT